MPKARIIAAMLALVALCASFTALSHAQSQPSLERLYILNCGEGVAGDISRWSPGVNEGKPMDFVDNCYLVKHAQGWMLWDTGVADAIAAMPDGQKPADPRATHRKRPKTRASQLDQLGVKLSDIKYVAVSHSHPDHIGNIEMFPQAMLLVQKAEYEWPGANNMPRFKPEHPVTKLEGDKDVFGDGSVTIISTPGHTPGHQSVRVGERLVIGGDVTHFASGLDDHRFPMFGDDFTAQAASADRLRALRDAGAVVRPGHDPAVLVAGPVSA